MVPPDQSGGPHFRGNAVRFLLALIALAVSSPIAAQTDQATSVTLPVNTLVEVTPAEEITSKKMKEGTTRQFLTVNDIAYDGTVVIPRGSLVTSEVTWRTGKGIVGKSAKFELTFRSVRVNGAEKLLRGTHRQEGRGNTAGALLGSMIITGRSATMEPGMVVNVFTAEPITVSRPIAADLPASQPPVAAPRTTTSGQANSAPAATSHVRCDTCRP